MPVIRVPENDERWLDPGVADGRELLKPYPAQGAAAYPIGVRVNRPRHDDPGLLDRMAQGRAP